MSRSKRGLSLIAAAALAALTMPSPSVWAKSNQQRPWYLDVRFFCVKHIPMTSSHDILYWDRLLPRKKEKELGIERVGVMARTISGTSASIVMQIPPRVMQEIAAKGNAAFPGDIEDMSKDHKRDIERSARLQAQALIDTQNNLKAIALFGSGALLTLAGVPAAGVQAFGSLKKLYKGASIAGAILAVEQSTRYSGPIPKNADSKDIDPRRLAQFFYGSARIQRTFSILEDAENPSQKWFMTQVSLLAADVTEKPVLIPFFSCRYPIK